MNKSKVIMLKGIEKNVKTTLGTIEITLFGTTTLFHVVPDNLALPIMGISGAVFFEKV